MEQRPLGSVGLMASAQGLGAMGMTAFYKPTFADADEAEALRAISRALELGVNFIDTAWVYQRREDGATNEELVRAARVRLRVAALGPSLAHLRVVRAQIGKALAAHGRDKFIVATKCGMVFREGGGGGLDVDNSPATIRSQLDDSLKRLGTTYVDLFYIHRIDPRVAIEDTMACLKEARAVWRMRAGMRARALTDERGLCRIASHFYLFRRQLVAEGKVRHVGLSECTPDELRRAHSVHPVSALQLEWSLQTRDAERSLVPTARELGVGIVAYSPLGRGLLARAVTRRADLAPGDWRLAQPRFSDEALSAQAAALTQLDALAAARGVTAAQLALAWVHARGRDVFPIPGARRVAHVEQNAAAAALRLSAEECAALEAAVPEPTEARYADMRATFGARMGAA
jgi:aryl-alcohol dehydrogenase-like predicted oxidoreductase